MSWLTSPTTPGQEIDIAGEAALCDDVDALASATQEQLPELGASDVFALLKRVASGELGDEERKRLLACLTQATLASDLAERCAQKLFSPLGEPPTNAPMLMMKLADLNPGGKLANRGAVDWEIVSMDRAKTGAVGDVALEIGGALGAMLSLRAAATLPGKELPTPNLVRVGMEGSLEVRAGASLPLPWPAISGTLSSASKSRIHIDYYTLHRPEQRFLQAVGEDLRHLAAPWDLQTLHARFQAADAPLQRMSLEAEGSFGLQGGITLAEGWDIGKGVAAQARVTFDTSLLVAGSFRIDCAPAANNRVRVDLHRRADVASERGLTVGVQIGLGSLIDRVKKVIEPYLGNYKDAFDMLDELFYGKGPIAVVVDEAVKQVGLPKLADETRAALAVTFGFADGDPAQAILQVIKNELPMVAGFWDESLPRPRVLALAKREVMEALGPVVRNYLPEDQLDKLLEQAIARAQPALKQHVEKLLGSETSARWLAALRKAGAKVDQKLDSSLAAAKQLLARFQKKLGEVRDVVETVAKAQMTLEIAGRRAAEKSDDLMLSMELDPASPAAQQAFRHFMMGSFDSLARTFEKGDSPDVKILGGHLQSVRKARRAYGFKVIFADFELGGESIFSSEVVVRHTLAGIEVMTKAVYEQRQKIWRVSRVVTFVNATHIAAAAKTRTMAASLTLSHADRDLEPDEAIRFFDGLEDAGLLAQGTAQRAARLIAEAKQKNVDVKGQLDVALVLSGRQLDALLNVKTARPLELGLLQGPLIQDIAIRELVAIALNTNMRSNLRKLLTELNIRGATLEDQVERMTENVAEEIFRKITGPGTREIHLYVERARSFRHCAELLVDLIETMRALYQSTPGQGGWTREQYEKAQNQLGRCLEPWLKMYATPFLMVTTSIRPYAIAFLASLIKLIEENAKGQAGDVKSMLKASITLTGHGGASKTLLLT